MLRNSNDIKLFLQQTKETNKRKKEREKQKYKKASETNKKLLDDKFIKEHKITKEKPKETHYLQFSVTIYHSNLIEREPDEEKLYTLQELQHIEELYPEEEGRINWIVWNKLISKFKKKDVVGYRKPSNG